MGLYPHWKLGAWLVINQLKVIPSVGSCGRVERERTWLLAVVGVGAQFALLTTVLNLPLTWLWGTMSWGYWWSQIFHFRHTTFVKINFPIYKFEGIFLVFVKTLKLLCHGEISHIADGLQSLFTCTLLLQNIWREFCSFRQSRPQSAN